MLIRARRHLPRLECRPCAQHYRALAPLREQYRHDGPRRPIRQRFHLRRKGEPQHPDSRLELHRCRRRLLQRRHRLRRVRAPLLVMHDHADMSVWTRRGSTVPNQPAGAFWAVLNRLLIIFQVIVLLLSEIGWPAAFFSRFFPILGEDFGLGALGVIQCLYVLVSLPLSAPSDRRAWWRIAAWKTYLAGDSWDPPPIHCLCGSAPHAIHHAYPAHVHFYLDRDGKTHSRALQNAAAPVTD